MLMKTFQLGDVVKVTQKVFPYTTYVSFGVVVKLPNYKESDGPWDKDNYYRVRLQTHDFHDFIEIGALAHEMETKP